MADFTKAVIEALSQSGCYFVRRGKGDHTIWYSPVTKQNFPVDGKIKSRYIANAVMKQSGTNRKF
jgi:hypothetical protein